MAGGINKAIIIGHLGADPEVRYTTGGSAVANFNIATTETWNDRDGQKQERTEWHRIVVWGKQAEIAGQYLSKGRQVYVEGRIQTRSWDDRDGNKRYTTEIVANQMTFLGGRGDGPRPESAGGGAARTSDGGNDREGFDYGPPPMTEDDVPF